MALGDVGLGKETGSSKRILFHSGLPQDFLTIEGFRSALIDFEP
jgi:hypothetical protein